VAIGSGHNSDPKELPDKATWYLSTNLPHPGSERAADSELEAADLAEIVRLYGLSAPNKTTDWVT
jgi:hypothetical protein